MDCLKQLIIKINQLHSIKQQLKPDYCVFGLYRRKNYMEILISRGTNSYKTAFLPRSIRILNRMFPGDLYAFSADFTGFAPENRNG